ncbi:MAG: hypothetical protein SGILL_003640 [Bacillariaceae sp.]
MAPLDEGMEGEMPLSPIMSPPTKKKKKNVNDEVSDDETASSTSVADEETPPAPKRRRSRGNFELVMKKITRTRSIQVGAAKFVHFANKLEEVLEIDSCRNLSSEQKSRSWWSSSEKSKMMARHEKIVNRMESKKPCKEHQTYRGLEAWTEEGTNMLDEVINRCVDAVLTEQEHQWVKQKDDFDRIATVSRSLTAECAKRARQVGENDEEEAREAISDVWVEDDDGSVCSVLSVRNRKSKLKMNYETLDNPYAKDLRKAKKSFSSDSEPDSPKGSPETSKKKKVKKQSALDSSRSSASSKTEKKKKAGKKKQGGVSQGISSRPTVGRNPSELDTIPMLPRREESIATESVTSSALPSLASFTVAESVNSSVLPSLSSFTSQGDIDELEHSFSSSAESEAPSMTTRQSCDPPGRRALSPVSETRASRVSPRATHKKKKPPRTPSGNSLMSENSEGKKSRKSKKKSSRKKDREGNDENSIFSSIVVPLKNTESMTSISSGDSTLGFSTLADNDQKVRDFVRIASFITGDRAYRFKKYPSVFVGSEVVSALVNEGVAATRAEAVTIGRQLQKDLGLFRHVCDDHEFEDKWLFFRFRVTVLSQFQQNAGFVKQDSFVSLTTSLPRTSTHS